MGDPVNFFHTGPKLINRDLCRDIRGRRHSCDSLHHSQSLLILKPKSTVNTPTRASQILRLRSWVCLAASLSSFDKLLQNITQSTQKNIGGKSTQLPIISLPHFSLGMPKMGPDISTAKYSEISPSAADSPPKITLNVDRFTLVIPLGWWREIDSFCKCVDSKNALHRTARYYYF